MPISVDRFEEIDKGREMEDPGTNVYKVVSFLVENSDKAFTQSEIAENIDIKEGSVGPTLVRLREKGQVEHRGKYWKISDQYLSLNHTISHSTKTAESHEEEEFNYDEWKKHAVDPRKHRE